MGIVSSRRSSTWFTGYAPSGEQVSWKIDHMVPGGVVIRPIGPQNLSPATIDALGLVPALPNYILIARKCEPREYMFGGTNSYAATQGSRAGGAMPNGPAVGGQMPGAPMQSNPSVRRFSPADINPAAAIADAARWVQSQGNPGAGYFPPGGILLGNPEVMQRDRNDIRSWNPNPTWDVPSGTILGNPETMQRDRNETRPWNPDAGWLPRSRTRMGDPEVVQRGPNARGQGNPNLGYFPSSSLPMGNPGASQFASGGPMQGNPGAGYPAPGGLDAAGYMPNDPAAAFPQQWQPAMGSFMPGAGLGDNSMQVPGGLGRGMPPTGMNSGERARTGASRGPGSSRSRADDDDDDDDDEDSS